MTLLGLILPIALLGAATALGLGFDPRREACTFLGLAWGAGVLLTTALLFALYHAGMPPTGALFPLLLVLLGLGGILAFRRTVGGTPPPTSPGWERGLFALAVVVALAATLSDSARAAFQPILDGDEAHLFALRAKIAFVGEGFGEHFRAETGERNFVRHPDYPLAAPLLHLWAYLRAGEIVHATNRVPIQLFMPALLLVFAGALRRRVRPALAAVSVLALAVLPTYGRLSRDALTDGVVAFCVVLAADGWMRWREDGDLRGPRLVALGFGLALFSKNEGAMYGVLALVAVGLGFALRSRAPRTPGVGASRIWWLLPLGALAMTAGFNAAHGFRSDIWTGSPFQGEYGPRPWEVLASESVGRLGTVLGFLARRHLASFPGTIALPLMGCLLVLVAPRRVTAGALLVPWIFLGLSTVALALAYLATFQPLDWHLHTSAQRVGWQTIPALLLVVSVALARLEPRFAPGSSRPLADPAAK